MANNNNNNNNIVFLNIPGSNLTQVVFQEVLVAIEQPGGKRSVKWTCLFRTEAAVESQCATETGPIIYILK